MAEYAWRKGWRSASLATDTVIVYFKNVVQAFEARWKQLGGQIVTKETYQSAPAAAATSGRRRHTAEQREGRRDRDRRRPRRSVRRCRS